MKVLIIEDIGSKSSMLRNYMEVNFDAKVDCVTNEYEAKNKLIDSKSYDVVLLDMTLPDMVHKGDLEPHGGMNVLSFMQHDNIIIPVIVVTSYWDFKHLLKRETKELYYSFNKLFQTKIDYDAIEMVEDFDYLDRMHKHMSYTYEQVYFGCLEFSYHNESWKGILGNILKELHK